MQIWDWMIDMTKKSTEKVLKWSQENRERRREMTNKAVAKYREVHKDDPEYIQKRRETNQKASVKFRQNVKQRSPEEYEAYRAKERERLRRWRAKKKAEAAEKEAANEETKKGSPEA